LARSQRAKLRALAVVSWPASMMVRHSSRIWRSDMPEPSDSTSFGFEEHGEQVAAIAGRLAAFGDHAVDDGVELDGLCGAMRFMAGMGRRWMKCSENGSKRWEGSP
jgi:hypothetical protein